MTLGIPELVEQVRQDLMESEYRLAVWRHEVQKNRDDIKDYLAYRDQIRSAYTQEEKDAIPPVPRPYDMSKLDAPLSVQSIELEIAVTIDKNVEGGVDLAIISGGGSTTHTSMHKVKLSLHAPYEIDVGG